MSVQPMFGSLNRDSNVFTQITKDLQQGTAATTAMKPITFEDEQPLQNIDFLDIKPIFQDSERDSNMFTQIAKEIQPKAAVQPSTLKPLLFEDPKLTEIAKESVSIECLQMNHNQSCVEQSTDGSNQKNPSQTSSKTQENHSQAHESKKQAEDPEDSFDAMVDHIGQNTQQRQTPSKLSISNSHAPEEERPFAPMQHVVSVVQNLNKLEAAPLSAMKPIFDAELKVDNDSDIF